MTQTSSIVKIYVKWINDPNMGTTLKDVPERWREKVEEELKLSKTYQKDE